MAFNFNFSVPGIDETSSDTFKEERTPSKHDVKPKILQTSQEIFIPEAYEPSDYDVMELTLHNGEIIQYIDSHIIEEKLKNDKGDELKSTVESTLGDTLSSGSDLQTNVYEGGLKIWECSIDLVEYISDESLNFKGINVLEVGCGAGIPGVHAYCKGATVHFSDYNWEVLKYITIPNVLFNTEAESSDEKHRCRFFSGDWSSLMELLCQDSNSIKYDVILTSETIYNPQNYGKLITLMEKLLKPSGYILLAAKTCYFAVGGGIASFEAEIKKHGLFNFTEVKSLEEGVQRKIIKLDFKKR